MSIIERIQQRQQGAESAAVQQMDAEMAEANKPDATVQAKEGRAAHSAALQAVPDQPDDSTTVEPGPEEQAVLTKMEKAMIEMIHGPGMTSKMLKAVTSGQDAVHGVGTVACDIVLKLKREIPGATDDVLSALGQRTVEEIVEIAEVANPRLNFSEDDMAEAYSIGIQNYMKSGQADVDEDEMREFLANG